MGNCLRAEIRISSLFDLVLEYWKQNKCKFFTQHFFCKGLILSCIFFASFSYPQREETFYSGIYFSFLFYLAQSFIQYTQNCISTLRLFGFVFGSPLFNTTYKTFIFLPKVRYAGSTWYIFTESLLNSQETQLFSFRHLH